MISPRTAMGLFDSTNAEPETGQLPLTRNETKTTTRTPMADPNAPKNLLSADVEIKGSIKFTNDLTIDG